MSEHNCGECGKPVNWRTNNCVWMCRRYKQNVYRLYFHLQCFEEIAGEEYVGGIVERGSTKYDDRRKRRRS